jgi:hypothetical protein
MLVIIGMYSIGLALYCTCAVVASLKKPQPVGYASVNKMTIPTGRHAICLSLAELQRLQL